MFEKRRKIEIEDGMKGRRITAYSGITGECWDWDFQTFGMFKEPLLGVQIFCKINLSLVLQVFRNKTEII